MTRVLLWMLRVAGWMLALLAVAMLVVAGMRALAIDDADRAALARMDAAPPPLRGANGFAALMLADRDVPAAERDAILADDVAAFSRWNAGHERAQSLWATVDAGDAMPAFEPFSALPPASMPASDELCALGAGCLERVRADPDGTRALLATHAARVRAIEDALAADYIASPYEIALAAPLPAYQNVRLPLAAAAMDAVGGDVDAAYARTCRLLAGARRADRTARLLIDKLVAQSLGRAAATLLLDLRRAYPVASLPGECAAARAPVDADEAAVCSALRGEFRMIRAHGAQMTRQLRGWAPERWLSRTLLYDEDLQALNLARTLAPLCADDAGERALAGALPDLEVDGSLDTLECWSAYVSCVLGRIAAPSYAPHASRALDHAAVLRLLLAAQRVADGDASPARAAVEAGVEGYPVAFDTATQRASITLRSAAAGDTNQFVVDFAGLAPSPVLPSADAIAFAGR